ncbi:hypothetical protein [Lysinibacillus agricola]|uniref:hypothetical protein n=1 Tax=Lysinibacillus agricola TaxID=2590012 RepID=UPI003C29C0D3
MHTNTLEIPKINHMIENVLEGLELKFSFSNNVRKEGCFFLDFIKPMPQGKSLEYTIVISAKEESQSVTILVTDIKDFKLKKASEDFYRKLNFLNASTLYGTVFYFTNSRKELLVSYSHSIPVNEDYKAFVDNIVTILDYIDFFILEIKNILSEDFQVE